MEGVSQGPPPKPRYGSYNTSGEDRAEIAVQVKAADFNGSDFDGRPFSAMPDWLKAALLNQWITPNQRRHTDYADWDITTKTGIVTAGPGDWIIRRERGDLSVVAEQDAYILINLRPPVTKGDAEKSAW